MAELLNKNTFKEKIFNFEENQEWKFEGDKPSIIDFYADWCGPCQMLAPIYDELSTEYKDKVDFYKIDTEQEQELAAMFNVRSIPTIVFINTDGKKPQILNGALPKIEFKKVIKQVFDIESEQLS
ncbi:thioredoxin [Flavobacteriaceae bacterium Ap0902]|nr:thioredoxin [Flavobacteriaceae bacterium Ap0902]